jgi:predicted Zn-dependent protease
MIATLALRWPTIAHAGEAAVAGEAAPAVPADPEGAPPLSGQLSTKFKIDPANPEASIPSPRDRDRSPLEFGYLLQDLLQRAEEARKAKDWSAVIRYYRAVSKAVPENAKGWSKLCEAYEMANDRERAIVACRYAIDRPAAELQDYARYVHMILLRPDPLSPEARQELAKVLGHLDTQPEVKVAASHLRCEVAVRLADAAQLQTCTQSLATLAPDDPKTVVFQWTLATMKGEKQRAEDLVVRARAVGVAQEGVARMEAVTLGDAGMSMRSKAMIGATAAALLAAGLAVAFTRRRRRDLGGGRAAA